MKIVSRPECPRKRKKPRPAAPRTRAAVISVGAAAPLIARSPTARARPTATDTRRVRAHARRATSVSLVADEAQVRRPRLCRRGPSERDRRVVRVLQAVAETARPDPLEEDLPHEPGHLAEVRLLLVVGEAVHHHHEHP